MILIDTNLLIEFFLARNKQETRFTKITRPSRRYAISVLSLFEIYKGVRPGQETFWEELFLGIEIIPFNEECSLTAAEIWRGLHAKRVFIDFLDLGIAATAIAHRTRLATLNIRHFTDIERLVLLDE